MKTEKTSSDFIREQPATTSAAEVVEKGKAAGFTFDASLVGKVLHLLADFGSIVEFELFLLAEVHIAYDVQGRLRDAVDELLE